MFEIVKRTVLLLLLLSLGYVFLILRPKINLANKALEAEKIVAEHHSNLLQNRLAYVQLSKLDSESPSFDHEKSELIATIKKTNKEGLKNIEEEHEIPELNENINNDYDELLQTTQEVLEKQNNLLNKVFQTSSFEQGTIILKSNEAIEILTEQTNLILKYEFLLSKIRELRNLQL